MPETKRKFRFGVGTPDGGPGGSYWTVATNSTTQDVYVGGTNPNFMHVSLHDGDRWHAKIERPDGAVEYVNQPRPSPLVPGCTRALQISAPGTWGGLDPPVTDRPVCWVFPPMPVAEVEIRFHVFFEDDNTDLTTWPARDSMHTLFVGRRELPLGGYVTVVADCVPWVQRNFTPTVPVADFDQAVDPRVALYGTDTSDGTFLVLVGRAVPIATTSPA